MANSKVTLKEVVIITNDKNETLEITIFDDGLTIIDATGCEFEVSQKHTKFIIDLINNS